VTLVHRGSGLKPTVKYWLKPDLENRIEEGAIAARFDATVVAFRSGEVEVATPGGNQVLPAAAVYVLIGYRPDLALARAVGVTIDPVTEVPCCDPETCESNVPGFYIAGTLQAGRATNQIFIENSRDHGPRIVAHLLRRCRPGPGSPAADG
jgi:thioredoxin reductase (NADPH)